MPSENPRKAQYFPDGISMFVPNLMYHSDVGTDGLTRAQISAPPAVSATGILSAQDVAASGTTSTFAGTYSKDAMGEYGRAVSVVASGASTAVISVRGRDYLGQAMREDLTLNGTTPVLGKKTFKYIDSVSWTAGGGGVTMNMGWLDVFGLPFCADTMIQENVNDAVPASAGTFTPAVKTDPATATTGATRGSYAPHTSNASNGSRTYRLYLQVDKDKLHGVAQYYA
jgi:hypothetical protein